MNNNRVVNKEPATQRESFTELLGQLAKNSAAVIHDEIELVIQRVRETVRAARGGVFSIATGAVIVFAAFLSLCAALIIGLTSYMAPAVATLVTGAALALIGVVIAFIALGTGVGLGILLGQLSSLAYRPVSPTRGQRALRHCFGDLPLNRSYPGKAPKK